MRRRPLILGGAVLGGLILVALFVTWLSYGRIGEWVVRNKVLPRVEHRLGRSVTVGAIDVGRGELTLRDVVVPSLEEGEPALVEIEEIRASFDYGASWTGDVILHVVTVDGLTARPRRLVDGTNNYSELVDRLTGQADSPSGEAEQKSSSRLRPRSLRLVNSKVELVDDISGGRVTASGVSAIVGRDSEITLTLDHLQASAAPSTVFGKGLLRTTRPAAVPAGGLDTEDEDGTEDEDETEVAAGEGSEVARGGEPAVRGPSATLTGVVVTSSIDDLLGSAHAEVAGGELYLWKGMTLTGITGNIRQGERAGHLVLDLSGGYGGAKGTLWRADGWLEPAARRGNVKLEADRFTFDRIGQVLQGSMVLDYEDTSIDAAMEIDVEAGRATLTGELSLSGLNLHHPMISEEPIRDLSLDGELMASFDSAKRTLELSSAKVFTRGVEYQLEGAIELPGGQDEDGSRRAFPRLRAHVVVPKAPCQKVLNSIPAEFVPRLQGFVLTGDFSTDLSVAIDWENLQEKTELVGRVGLFDCKVKEPREEFDAERLQETFEHQIMVGPDEWEEVTIGMESDNYVQIFDISPYLLNSIMTTEDSAFYKHKGFITREFKSALIKNLEAGFFKYGASSITMQMVKNVFLYREKSLSRKIQELFLTWYVESVLEKNRILEIYVNAIEYGPGIYGITKAAQLYFDKHPRELNPVEAAYFSYLLPAPRRRYFQWCTGKLTRAGENKIKRVLKRMLERERLTQEEYDEAIETEIEFNPVKVKELCKEPPDW